ncbi:hypothetical protein I8G32_01364 [Rhodopseudomonas palustris]|uniref:STN domain-containing protein n=1 Tax=Rhodopseudomonas palustris (strain ATCC BAA-98 / CGA009) TaxID=258594 RepID=Q6NA53_RHOPA|nr:STN domain-containing protein [Rhodopseudomonas palustris]OPF91414.1 energy transducer TonB [Rhodopseudomonas palustris]QQM02831.1 hypothetical protein I8G32_01364 [Rhodopseudomonas palustris]WAB79005.1 STN domain-containing protein [Rhodopseudomonas palustris]WCL91467.1 STN domain-containing protein [Rhodopseudomonas palustris CGA009]WND52904.1 STN domain-containing protein [Rhodopseudomonas palustris]
MPPALADQGVVLRVLVLAVSLLSNGVSRASDDPQKFDIAPRPLSEALIAFADQTGKAALIDAATAGGKTSSAVRGLLTPADALRIMLAGTGLSFRRMDDAAFAVGPNTQADDGDLLGRRDRASLRGYFVSVQTAMVQALCRDAVFRATPYRSAVQVWIGWAGDIAAVHALGGTGDAERDARIAEAIAMARVPPPPIGLPQPVTLLLQRGPDDGAACPP